MNIYTELILESREMCGETEGAEMREVELKYGIKRFDTVIKTPSAAGKLGRKEGRYITLEAKNLEDRDLNANIYLAKCVGKAVGELIRGCGLPKNFTALVVGIGNRGMTADALGPRVVQDIIVTRHFLGVEERVGHRFSPVCAIAPGVLGETGMDSFEVIKSLAESIKPALIIAVDSLASRRSERISGIFQFSDTGITPGGGLGNTRPALNRETLGVPVLAAGVPFVVHARTMGYDIAGELMRRLPDCVPAEQDAERAVRAVVSDLFGELVVTPKDIDRIVSECAFVLSLGINLALHPKMSAEDILAFIH